MSVEELVKRLRSQDHLMQRDSFAALWVTASQAADKLEELAAENERLRFDDGAYKNVIKFLNAALAEKDKEIAALREALEPFSRVADLIDVETEGLSEDDEIDLLFHDYLMDRYTVADFKRARNAGGKDVKD